MDVNQQLDSLMSEASTQITAIKKLAQKKFDKAQSGAAPRQRRPRKNSGATSEKSNSVFVNDPNSKKED